MKKSFLSIISLITLFAISSCACQGPRDKHYNSSEAEKKAEEYTSYKSYSLSTTIVLKGTATFKDEKTKGNGSWTIGAKSKVDGDNALELNKEEVSLTKESYSLDEVITNSGNKTVAELKEMYPRYTFDETKRTVTLEESMISESAKDKTYYIYDTEYEQYKKLVFDSKNNCIDSSYTDYDDTDDARDEYFIIHNLKDIIKEALVNGKPENGVYTLEPEGGIKIDDIVLDKATFKHDGVTMTLNGELAGEILGLSNITEASVEVKATDLDKVKIDVPNQEVVCEHEHKFASLDDFGEKGHRKMCYDCHKYLDKNVVAHTLDSKHKICTVCAHHPEYESNYCPQELINKKGFKLLPNLKYSNATNEIIGSSYIYDSSDYKALVSSSFSFKIGESSKSGRVLYYDKDEVLIICYENSNNYIGESCLKETESKVIAFSGVKITLTPEQQAIIDDTTSSSSAKTSAYKEALGLSSSDITLDSIKAGRTILKEFNMYYMSLSHNSSSSTPVEINSCLISTPSVCSKCNEVTYVSDDYSHDRHLSVIANPSWAKEGYFYFQYDECSKCHLKDESIYEIEEGGLSSHYNGYSTSGKQYNKDGQQIDSYVSLYVPDHHDKDGECALCHAKVITAGNVSIHVNANGIAENTSSYNGFPYWQFDNYQYEDGWAISTYSKDGVTIKLKEKSEDGKRTFILICNEVESSPVVINVD